MNQINFLGSPNLRGLSLIQLLSAFKSDFFLIGTYSFVANILTLAPTVYMLQIFDRVMISQSDLTLISLTLIVAIFIASMGVAEWVRSRLLVRIGIRLDEQLHTPIFNARFDASLEQGKADHTNHFSALTRFRQFVTGNGLIAFFDLPWVPIYLAVLFTMHPLLGWFGIVFTLFLAILAWLTSRLTSDFLGQAASAEVRSSDYLAGKLRNIEVVQSMGMLESLRHHWFNLYVDYVNATWRAQQRLGISSALFKFVQYSQQSLILALGAWLAIRGELTLGAMIASNVLMGNALRPIGILVSTWKGFIQAHHEFGDIRRLLEKYPPQTGDYVKETVVGDIKLQQLSAYARQRRKPILNSIDFHFQAGEVVGIAGPSGAGKSTLARCLIGIWPNTSGKVLLDGVDVRDWSREVLGPHIGYLPQDIELFEGTVAENICRFGDINAEAIVDAAKQAGIHEMILRLPVGYDTAIGQAGRSLSGGQRQRLALARAIYGAPNLIVLDEPNANLDDVGEASLMRTIGSLKDRGATVFLISHQRHLLTLTDRVIFLEDGQIIKTLIRSNNSQTN